MEKQFVPLHRTKAGLYVSAESLTPEEQKTLFDETKEEIAKRDMAKTTGFVKYFEYNTQTRELQGGNLFHYILGDQTLIRRGFLFPGVREGRNLDAQGKLSNGVVRNYGLAIFSPTQYNVEIAKSLVEEAKRRGWELPVLAGGRSLDLKKGDNAYGLDVIFTDNPLGIISGEEAREFLKKFDYIERSGVQRVGRDADGDWGAGWHGLADSDDLVRGGDWVCAEGTKEKIKERFNAAFDYDLAQAEKRRAKEFGNLEKTLQSLPIVA
jgi:hypothetical protein